MSIPQKTAAAMPVYNRYRLHHHCSGRLSFFFLLLVLYGESEYIRCSHTQATEEREIVVTLQ